METPSVHGALFRRRRGVTRRSPHSSSRSGFTWVYLRDSYEDERYIETVLRDLAKRSTITLKTPMTETHWMQYLRDPNSALATRVGDDYSKAIAGQASVCAEIFGRPSVSLQAKREPARRRSSIPSSKRSGGPRAPDLVPVARTNGKAAERLREKTGRRGETATIHSFLAKRGWLNDNLTFKRQGGQQEDAITTYVIDESSMLSLELTAALFRSINWNSVQRLVLVGDPSQLPPIGRGRLFADVIDWLRPLGRRWRAGNQRPPDGEPCARSWNAASSNSQTLTSETPLVG